MTVISAAAKAAAGSLEQLGKPADPKISTTRYEMETTHRVAELRPTIPVGGVTAANDLFSSTSMKNPCRFPGLCY